MRFEDLPTCTLPKAVQLWHWMKRPLQFLEENRAKYGTAFFVHLSGLPKILMLADPASIREIFKLFHDDLDLADDNQILQPIVGAQSVLFLKGKTHYEVKKRLMLYFSGQRLTRFESTIESLVSDAVKGWSREEEFELTRSCQELAYKVICSLLFPELSTKESDTLNKNLLELVLAVSSPLKALLLFNPILRRDWGPWSPGGKLKSQREKVLTLLRKYLENLHTSGQTADNSLVLAIEEIARAFSQDGDSFVMDQVVTLLVAGFETTASALSWSIYALATFGWEESVPFTAFINEVLRYFPIAPIAFTRVACKNMTLQGISIPEGTFLSPCMYLVHRDENTFAETNVFNPKRFVEKDYSPFEFFPFGGGLRKCLGAALAVQEMKVLLHAVHEYDIKLRSRDRAEPKRRVVTLEPNRPMWASITALHRDQDRSLREIG